VYFSMNVSDQRVWSGGQHWDMLEATVVLLQQGAGCFSGWRRLGVGTGPKMCGESGDDSRLEGQVSGCKTAAVAAVTIPYRLLLSRHVNRDPHMRPSLKIGQASLAFRSNWFTGYTPNWHRRPIFDPLNNCLHLH
jgi:hypothetical protein